MSGEPSAARLRRTVDRVAWGGAALAVLVVGVALLLGERMQVEHELLLARPSAVAPGTTLPVRALLVDRSEESRPRSVAADEVIVRLLDAEGRVAMRGVLKHAPTGAEATLAVPERAGTYTLEASAHLGGEVVARAAAGLEVTAAPPPARRLGRLASALQHLEVGPVEGSAPPAPFDVRVASGACVPEVPCAVLVHVGEPPAVVRALASPSVTPEGESALTSGLVPLPVVVHGPEARTTLVATRDGIEVGRRAVQLPVALATPAFLPSARVVAAEQAIELEARALGAPPGLIADFYSGGVWRRTESFVLGGSASLGPLPPGRWRVQVHADPFSSERSAIRDFVVRAPGQSAEEAVEHAIAGAAPPGAPELRLAWAAARTEDQIWVLPARISGRPAALTRLETRRRALRVAAVLTLALGIVVASALFVRRGVDAAIEAQRIMDATGEPSLATARHRRRTLASALALVGTLILALVAAAALVLVRAGTF